MIKAVIFDLDGTLYDYDTAHAAGCRRLGQYVQQHFAMPPAVFDGKYRRTMERTEELLGEPCAAMHDRSLRFQLLLEEEGLPVIPHARIMTQLYWHTLLDAMELSPGVRSCLPALKKAGYRLGVGTNMQVDWQLCKLERLGLGEVIDFLVTSEEAQAEKPDGRLFRLCAQKAGCVPEECLFVGDSLKHDVFGAKAAGMQAIWFQPDGDRAAQFPQIPSIQSFDDLWLSLCPEKRGEKA